MNTAQGLLLFLVLASPASGQKTAGGEAFEFLLLDAGARAAALGGAYTAAVGGADALRYNPAGLALTRRYEAGAMHDQYFQGATHEYLALAAPAGWGASLDFLNFGNITRTTLSQHTNAGGSVGLSDTAVGAGYGRRVLDSPESGWAAVGLGVKYLHESIDNVGANGIAADVGVLYRHRAAPGLTLGVSALNFGPDVSFQGKREKLPVDLHLGLAFAFGSPGLDNTLTLETFKARSDKAELAAGFETVVRKTVALRLGFTSRNAAQTGVTGGVGILWKGWSLDYAAAAFGELGMTNAVSLTYRWGAEEKTGPRDTSTQNSFIYALMPKLSSKRPGAAPREATPAARPSAGTLAPSAFQEPLLPAAASDREEHFALAQRFIADRAYGQAKRELALAAPFGGDDRRLTIYFEQLGVVALDEDDMEKALKLGAGLASALDLKPGPADPYAGAGFCMLVQGDAGYALKFFDKALDLSPSPKTRRWIEGRILEIRGRAR